MAEQRRPSKFAIGVGVLLVAVGVVNLLDNLIPYDFIAMVGNFMHSLWRFAWPALLIIAGIYLLWAAKKGKLSNPNVIKGQGSLRRSLTDRRIMGVCGGIARYFGLDSSVVRVIAVFLLFFLTPMTLIAYFLIAAVTSNE